MNADQLRIINEKIREQERELARLVEEKRIVMEIMENESKKDVTSLVDMLLLYPEQKHLIQYAINRCLSDLTLCSESSHHHDLDNYDLSDLYNEDNPTISDGQLAFQLSQQLNLEGQINNNNNDDGDDESTEESEEEEESSEEGDFLDSRVRIPIPEVVMKKLTKMKYKNDNSVIKFDSCSICVEKYRHNHDKIFVLPCGHIYHQKCGNKWFNQSCICPVCRRDIRTMV